MKSSDRSGFIFSIIFITLLSVLYGFLVKIGLDKQNINLKKVQKATNIVEHFGIDLHYGSKSRKSNVFYIKLKDLNEKVGVYRFSKDYGDLLSLINDGDRITVYYYQNSNERENVNIDLIQIEKENKILLHKSEYENKERTLIFVGIAGIISNIIILYYSRKKYFKKIKK